MSVEESQVWAHLQNLTVPPAGLAMFVYMDGEYQCNRNRHNLRIPDARTTSRQTEVDFRVRQKEEIQANGTFIGSQWKFRELNIGKSVFLARYVYLRKQSFRQGFHLLR